MTKMRTALPSLLLTAVAFATTAAAQAPTPTAPAAKPAMPPAAAAAATKPMMASPAGAPGAKPAMAPTAAPAAPMKMAAPAPAAAAAQPASPPMPAPSKDLEAFMKGFEGSWKCDTKFAAGSMGPGSPEVTAKTTVKIKKEFGGFAWHGEYNLPKSKVMPSMSGIFQIAHDSGSNQATIVGYDSMGSSFMGAGAIAGDMVSFTEDGYMMGAKTKVRETMIKKGPKEIVHKFEVDMGRGFQQMGEDACKK